jgi:hypothetical protein
MTFHNHRPLSPPGTASDGKPVSLSSPEARADFCGCWRGATRVPRPSSATQPLAGGRVEKIEVDEGAGAGVVPFPGLHILRGAGPEKAKGGGLAGLRPGRAGVKAGRVGLLAAAQGALRNLPL